MEFFKTATDFELIEWIKNDKKDRVAQNLSGYWPKHPPKVVAIGDLHGDWDALIQTLVFAELIISKDDLNWKGGDTFVVQCGDILDRKGRFKLSKNAPHTLTDESQELRLLAYLAWLNDQAEQQGGRVLGVIGNHEWMNFVGDMSYTTPNTRKAFLSENQQRRPQPRKIDDPRKITNESNLLYSNGPRKNALEPKGWLAEWISRNKYWMVQIQQWIFVHGGFFADYPQPWYQALRVNALASEMSNAPNRLRITFTELLRNVLQGNPVSYEQQKLFDTLVDGVLMNRSVGISLENRLPSRRKSLGDPGNWTLEEKQIVNSVGRKCYRTQHALKYFNANYLVVGHTPQHNFSQGCNGRVWRVDIMMSKAFLPSGGRKVGYLEITWDDKNEVHPVPKTKNRNYPEIIRKILYPENTIERKRTRNNNQKTNQQDSKLFKSE